MRSHDEGSYTPKSNFARARSGISCALPLQLPLIQLSQGWHWYSLRSHLPLTLGNESLTHADLSSRRLDNILRPHFACSTSRQTIRSRGGPHSHVTDQYCLNSGLYSEENAQPDTWQHNVLVDCYMHNLKLFWPCMHTVLSKFV